MTKTMQFRIKMDISYCVFLSIDSILLVVSSKRRKGVSLRKIRAKERRCLCPPDSPICSLRLLFSNNQAD